MYTPFPGETFFSHLILFNDFTQESPFDAFLPIDGNYTAHGFSVSSAECPFLSLGALVFPDMSHTMQFVGSNSDCYSYDPVSFGISDPALVIHSNLKNDRLPLGSLLNLQNNTADDMTTVFSKEMDAGFVSVLHSVQVSVFSGVLSATARIEDSVIEMSGESDVFGFPARVNLSADTNSTEWDDLIFTVDGEMLSGDGSFVNALFNGVLGNLQVLAESGTSRLALADRSLNQAIERLNDTRRQYMEAEANARDNNAFYNSALLEIKRTQDRLVAVEVLFNSSEGEVQTLEQDLNRICTEKFCKSECKRGNISRNCSKPTFINQTSRCPTVVREKRQVRVRPFIKEITSWEWVTVCQTQSKTECFKMQCPVGEKTTCNSRCVPKSVLEQVYNWKTVEVEVRTFTTCTLTLFNSSIPQVCREEVDCAVFAPNNSCIQANADCKKARELALKEVERARENSTQVLRELVDARRRLSLAQTNAATAKVRLNIAEQRRDKLSATLQTIEDATEITVTVHDQTLQQIKPLLTVDEILKENKGDMHQVFDITNITFSSVFSKESPRSLRLVIAYETPYNSMRYEDSYIYLEFLKDENLELIVRQIIATAFSSTSKRSVHLNKRQVSEAITRREIFASRCVDIFNTQLFFTDLHEKLEDIRESIDTTRSTIDESFENIESDSDPSLSLTVNLTVLETEFNTTTTAQDLSGSDDEEVNAYLDLIGSYKDLSMESLRSLERTAFSEWQASMEYLYSESGSVGDYVCSGFADCLQTAVNELCSLISLTPEHELHEEFLYQADVLTAAKENVLDLAISTNLSINEALANIAPIIEVANVFATDNYWCSDPPVMVVELPPVVNVSLDDSLRLTCEAESDLLVAYEWRKNGNILPGFNTNELVLDNAQRLDSGNYTCFASNPVGSAESITTSVSVYELPEFYLLPVSVATYFGDDNGAWFGCNASASPNPGWRWYYRATEELEWTEIEGEDTNELFILDPQQEHEGWYTCEAFNYHGSIRADSVSLTLLPFSISLQQFLLGFSISVPNFEDDPSCSFDDLYDSVYDLVTETLGPDVTTLDDFNITNVYPENYDVVFSLTSENATTRYLHLMSFGEIANLALPKVVDLHKYVDVATTAFSRDVVRSVCQARDYSISPGSFFVDKLTYICPDGQRLNSDYLLCCKFF